MHELVESRKTTAYRYSGSHSSPESYTSPEYGDFIDEILVYFASARGELLCGSIRLISRIENGINIRRK